jgi:hypothetical protein
LNYTKGEFQAADGWRLDWDITTTPGHITATDTEGIKRWHISGAISEDMVRRELDAFRQEHTGQLRMFI